MPLSLGYLVADWLSEHVPLPGSSGTPWTLTDEQVAFLVRWYRVEDRGRTFTYRRGALQQAKGWGKSPLGAGIALAELAGPVVPDGLDAHGEPVGQPWGTGGTPPPWVQIAGISEDAAAANVFVLCFEALEADHGKAAADLDIDSGRTRLFRKDAPASRVEAVTSSSGSREGQRVTFALADETDKWIPANGGPRLARTLRRNAAKMGGRVLEFSNAFELGEQSVAEATSSEAHEPGVLYVANIPTVEVGPDSEDATVRKALDEAYGDAWWVDRARILAEIRDPAVPWADSRRYYLNLPAPGGAAAFDPRQWADLHRVVDVPERAAITAGFFGDGPAVALVGCVMGERAHLFVVNTWERPAAKEWRTPRDEVNAAVAGMFERFAVKRFYVEQRSWPDEAARWVDDHGDADVLAFPTASRVRMGPAIDRMLALVEQGTLSHSGDPILARHVGNAIRRGDLLEAAAPGRPIAAAKSAVLALAANADVPATPREFMFMDTEWIEQRRKRREAETARARRRN